MDEPGQRRVRGRLIAVAASPPYFTPSLIYLHDYDHDGDLDLAFGTDFAARNDGTGTFHQVRTRDIGLYPPSMGMGPFALMDVDGDAFLDAVFWLQTRTRADLAVLSNDGTARFDDAGRLPSGRTPGVDELIHLDIDNDGDLDVFVVGAWDMLYLSLGNGQFQDITARLSLRQRTSGVATDAGDFDGDGFPDLVIAGGWNTPRWYRNTGAVSYVPAGFDPLLGVPLLADVAAGDLDRDGWVDILAVTHANQDLLWLRNVGGGQFALQVLATGTAKPLVAQDVDTDGDLDVFIGSSPNARLQLFLNDGSGGLTNVTASHLPTIDSTNDVTLGDFDKDGDLDAFVSRSGPNVLLRNDGTGRFLLHGRSGLSDRHSDTEQAEVGDLDRDGDLDILVRNRGQSRILRNTTRHLAWTQRPRLGQPFTLDVRGPANGRWLLMYALNRGSLSLPGIGHLGLDPGSLSVSQALPLDAVGRAQVTATMPPFPGLAGSTVYWQTLLSPPVSLSPVESSTIANY
ncbi:MAG: VCBS repeat-containing protein [Planctomycetes bacterium]|nr:VCBS repeat-containing protein [Planctomycetota bacterium]